MRVLLVGNGGREHALAWRLCRSSRLATLAVTGPNPGWPADCAVHAASTVQEQADLAARLGVELVVVGPEAPLAAGLADLLGERGIPCFGPTRAAARLESSKAFAKEVLSATGVPTARALIVDTTEPRSVAEGRERCAAGRVVLKADGLAAGKGVVVCEGAEQALTAFDEMARFGEAARTVLLEDLLVGPEVSLFALCDGRRFVGLPSARDHKRLLAGDRGPNTGGMGAVAPAPGVAPALAERWIEELCGPVIAELARRGTPYRGVLYAGVMVTADGPRVIEFNVRFGDPECQALMALWDEDPLPWLYGCATGELPSRAPTFRDGSACCVVLASRGYPESSEKGVLIPEPPTAPDVTVFHAATQRAADGTLRTNGGRVLGITAVGPELATARSRAYADLPGWVFAGAQWRTDIGVGG
jgi:phosphoribosylamine---glycine ligase